jgi:hypothetical protein
MKKGEDKLIDGYLVGNWITHKQFDKLPGGHFKFIGKYNKNKNHHPRKSVKGKANKDYPKKNNKNIFKVGTASGLKEKKGVRKSDRLKTGCF